MNYCTSCGTQSSGGAPYCTSCGYQTGALSTPVITAPQPMSMQLLPRRSSKAVWALALGLLSAFPFSLFGIAAVPAIIMGVMARREMALTGERGRGMATAGVALGIAMVVLIVVLFVLVWSQLQEMSR